MQEFQNTNSAIISIHLISGIFQDIIEHLFVKCWGIVKLIQLLIFWYIKILKIVIDEILYLSFICCSCIETLLHQTYFILSAWKDKKRRKINYKQRMGLHRTQTTNNDNEDEREFTPALNILSQMIAITTFLCFYISSLLTLKAFKCNFIINPIDYVLLILRYMIWFPF